MLQFSNYFCSNTTYIFTLSNPCFFLLLLRSFFRSMMQERERNATKFDLNHDRFFCHTYLILNRRRRNLISLVSLLFSNPIEYLYVIIQGIQSFFLNLHSNGNATKQAARPSLPPFFFFFFSLSIYVCTRQGGIRDNNDDDHSSCSSSICSICSGI